MSPWRITGKPSASPARRAWRESGQRHRRMAALLREGIPPALDWLKPTLLNAGTRLAAVMRPQEGRLLLAGFTGERQVTGLLELTA